MLTPEDFFDLSEYAHRELFMDGVYVWDALKRLKAYIEQQLQPGIQGTVHDDAHLMNAHIQIGRGTIVEPGACIYGPTIIGKHVVVRHGAYIRGHVIVGDHCVVGHASELKHSILLNHSKAPHFNYVGDSILGNYVNLGAGTILSNLKITKNPIRVKLTETVYDIGLRKLGAILGDYVETGCNSVLSPGALIGRKSLIYPNATVSGYVPPDTIVKLHQTFELAERQT